MVATDGTNSPPAALVTLAGIVANLPMDEILDSNSTNPLISIHTRNHKRNTVTKIRICKEPTEQNRTERAKTKERALTRK